MKKGDFENVEEFAEVIERLVSEKKTFDAIMKAFDARDAGAFHAGLRERQIEKYCRLICYWICRKKCILFCKRLDFVEKPPKVRDADEIRNFGNVVTKIVKSGKTLDRFIEFYEREDAKGFRALLEKEKIVIYGPQLCHWICQITCRRRCWALCPDSPKITHIGFIPTAQIDSEGYAMGPSEPQGTTAAPDSCRGHHPFGGITNIRGKMVIDNPDRYKVEVSSSPAGPWTPLTNPITETDTDDVTHTRYVSGGADPGWYTCSEMIDPMYLTDWSTPGDTTQKFHLRLTVMNTQGATFHSPVEPARIDNHAPQIENLDILVRADDGTERTLKCGGFKKGQGILVIKFRAWDENFRQLTLTAEGNSGLSIPVVDQVTGAQVSRCYNGNLADKGEPSMRVVEWDPWSHPRMIPCCYNVVLRIYDRTIVNNSFQSGRSATDWEAVEILLG